MLKFRPHHFMCTIGFQGKGYSDEFVENYLSISKLLSSPQGDHVHIQVVSQTDSICSPCPHRKGHLCNQQSKIESLDKRHVKALGLKDGQTLKWADAKKRIAEKVSEKTFNKICDGCSWKDLGICLTALKQLKATI